MVNKKVAGAKRPCHHFLARPRAGPNAGYDFKCTISSRRAFESNAILVYLKGRK